MKTNTARLIAASVTLSVGFYVIYSQQETQSHTEIGSAAAFEPSSTAPPTTELIQSHDEAISGLILADRLPATSASSMATVEAEAMSSDDRDEDNPYTNDAMKAQLMRVADMYEESSRYPANSQPVTTMEELKRFLPPVHSDVDMPFPIAGLDKPIQVALSLSRHQVFEGQPIDISLKLTRLPEDAALSVQASLIGRDGQFLKETGMNEVTKDNSLAVFSARFDTDSENTQQWPVELQVVVSIDINEHRLVASAPLKYNPPSAVLINVEASTQSIASLQIPLNFQVLKPGYFFVSANLFSRTTSLPVAHLEGEGRLAGQSGRLLLNAHATALQVSGDEGPYELRNISIIRSAEEGEDQDLAGKSSRSTWPVEGFRLESYDQTPYQDELTQERAEFLRKLGQL